MVFETCEPQRSHTEHQIKGGRNIEHNVFQTRPYWKKKEKNHWNALYLGISKYVILLMTASVSKITKNQFYPGNYVSRTATVNLFHSWLLFDESSRSLLTPSFLSHCQASLPAPTLRLPAERALLVNASELEMSHSTLSRGWSVPWRRPLLRN